MYANEQSLFLSFINIPIAVPFPSICSCSLIPFPSVLSSHFATQARPASGSDTPVLPSLTSSEHSRNSSFLLPKLATLFDTKDYFACTHCPLWHAPALNSPKPQNQITQQNHLLFRQSHPGDQTQPTNNIIQHPPQLDLT
jgi:hypothetical protein